MWIAEMKVSGKNAEDAVGRYRLNEQVGFILRKVTQRHTSIFAGRIPGELTPMQFAVLAKLFELNECSQNRLGRLVAMDAATVKGVVDRLAARGLVSTWADTRDRRRLRVKLTGEGTALAHDAIAAAMHITEETLAPLDGRERAAFLKLLSKLV